VQACSCPGGTCWPRCAHGQGGIRQINAQAEVY
jgi:hypothetical protein